jgi:hypothetical protein
VRFEPTIPAFEDIDFVDNLSLFTGKISFHREQLALFTSFLLRSSLNVEQCLAHSMSNLFSGFQMPLTGFVNGQVNRMALLPNVEPSASDAGNVQIA